MVFRRRGRANVIAGDIGSRHTSRVAQGAQGVRRRARCLLHRTLRAPHRALPGRRPGLRGAVGRRAQAAAPPRVCAPPSPPHLLRASARAAQAQAGDEARPRAPAGRSAGGGRCAWLAARAARASRPARRRTPLHRPRLQRAPPGRRLARDAARRRRGDGPARLAAGNAAWQPAGVMAARLRSAGIGAARGFALNVSNFRSTADSEAYGLAVSAALGGGVPFVIDTSRNGAGPAPGNVWCNPPGRGLGTPPTTDTGRPLVDAYLWVKAPGESDGACNGGPPAGTWWPEYAL